ncbi:Opn2sw [Columba guinea]|nr:Opn2sw [Columba guinea]
MQRAREARDELPDDFYIPMALDAPNLTALSPFLVPQTHLGSPGVFRGMAAFMLALIALGGPINALTIACTARYKKLRSHLNYILVNLAAANLLVICVGSTTAFYSFSQMYFALGPTACKIEGFAATLGGNRGRWGTGTLGTETLGPWDIGTLDVGTLDGCIWVYFGVTPCGRYIPEGLQCSCGPDWYTANNKWNNESYVIFLFCFCFGVPLALIVFSYGRLLLTLRAVARQQEQSASTQKAEREVTKMVVVMVLGFLVCWAPYSAFALWVVTHRGRPFDVGLASIPSVFSKASTVYNPVIYVFMNKQASTVYNPVIYVFMNKQASTVYNPVIYVFMNKQASTVYNPVIYVFMNKQASTVYNPVIYVFMNKQFRSCMLKLLFCGDSDVTWFRSCMLKLLFCGRSPFGDEDDVSGSSQATQVSSVGSASASQVAPA